MKLSTTTADLSGYAKPSGTVCSLRGDGFRIFDLSLYTINSRFFVLEKNDEWKKEIEAVGIMAEKLDSLCLCHGPSGQFYNGEESGRI